MWKNERKNKLHSRKTTGFKVSGATRVVCDLRSFQRPRGKFLPVSLDLGGPHLRLIMPLQNSGVSSQHSFCIFMEAEQSERSGIRPHPPAKYRKPDPSDSGIVVLNLGLLVSNITE